MKRWTKDQYYCNIATEVATRSTCLRRKYGAVIVKDDRIVSTGYNGAPRGRKNCNELGECKREILNIPSGERYELCRAVHAEQNAIIQANYSDTQGATLYLAGIDTYDSRLTTDTDCCEMCKRIIINAGITEVVFVFLREDCNRHRRDIRKINVMDWVLNDDSIPKTDELQSKSE